jgi:hypothetical protein
MPPRRPAPRSLACFTVVLADEATATAVVLHSAANADQATIAFHQTRERLLQDRTVGELVVVHHHDRSRLLLRERLGSGSVPLNPGRQHRARVVTVPTPGR